MHSWLTARTPRGRYAAAAGSAVLAGYAYTVHSRGLVMLIGYRRSASWSWRRLAPRRTVAVAALATAASVGAGWLLDRYLSAAIYPEGTRSLSGQMASRLRNVQEAINVFEMAAGQLWRLVLDSWGLAGIGLFAAIAVIARPRIPGGPADHGRAQRGGHRWSPPCTAPAALPAGPVPDLGLGTLPGRHDRHVLPGRRRGAAARPAAVRRSSARPAPRR